MLEISQIKELLKNPTTKSLIQKACDHEKRIRFHSETALTSADGGRAVTDFLEWVRGLLPADKFAIFCSLFRYPIKSVNLTDKAYQALEKVFDGRDAMNHYEFASEELEEDWNDYRENVLDEPYIWRATGFENMKTRINSVLIVDIAETQKSKLPEPYFYWLPIEDVIEFKDGKDQMEYIIFRQPGDKVAVFDDTSYRVFATQPNDKNQIIAPPLIDAPHSLGYCPARFFWDTPVNLKERCIKKSPISNYLGELDWYLFFSISKQHLDLYAPYPIYSGYEQECDYEYNSEDGTIRHHCDNGFLKNERDIYIQGTNGVLMACPVCGTKRIAGVGSFVEVPPPSPENGNADMRNPIQITNIDRQSLDYNVEEVTRLESVFYQGVTGYGGEPVNNQAVNEKQIIASFESRAAVLRNLKKDLESAQQWVDTTICSLRYGPYFYSASVNMGSEFYLDTAEDILLSYEKHRAAGSDDAVLDSLQDQYNETRYRNNPEQLVRVSLLKQLDPFRHLTKTQVRELYAAQAIEFPDFMLKTNFSSLILRFERENGNIVEYMSQSDLKTRVQAILAALYSYIIPKEEEEEENGTERQQGEPAGGPSGGAETS